MSTKRPPNDDQTASAPAPDAGGTKTARTIRDVLRSKAQDAADRRGGNLPGADQKPPRPPYGTRRSMGKR